MSVKEKGGELGNTSKVAGSERDGGLLTSMVSNVG